MTKTISKKQTYMLIALCIIIITTCIVMDIPLYIGLFTSVVLIITILTREGFSFKELINIILLGMKDSMSIYSIILLIGATIAIWMSSGIVPTIIYYGFDYLNGTNYLLMCFFVSMIIATVMGSALGTISTVGIALLGIGKGLNIPAPILLGAIISGAFVSDKISPIAALVNLTIKTTGIKYRGYLKSVAVTLVPTLTITLGIYYFIGKNYSSKIDVIKLQEYQSHISGSFYTSPLLILVPFGVMILALLGIRIVQNLTIALVGGIGLSIYLQQIKLMEILQIILRGYKGNTGMEELNSILKGGGILPMIEVVLVIAGAISLSSLFEGTGIIRPIIDQAVYKVKGIGSLVLKTSLLSNLLTIATCDQTVGILILGKLLKKKFKEVGFDNKTLARTIADNGTTIAPLIPWNSNGIIIAAITGIGATQYGLYASLCYISPIITIIVAYIGQLNNKKTLKVEG